MYLAMISRSCQDLLKISCLLISDVFLQLLQLLPQLSVLLLAHELHLSQKEIKEQIETENGISNKNMKRTNKTLKELIEIKKSKYKT